MKTYQPPYENIGTDVVIPIGTHLASGFGISHRYTYPRVEGHGYSLKEEETIFIAPLAAAVNPKLSFGANVRVHILEYLVRTPSTPTTSGNAFSADLTLAALFKVSQRFRAGLTVMPESFAMRAEETEGPSEDFSRVDRATPWKFRFGAAMYPRKWFSFFGDLEYEKYRDLPYLQPGFHLGAQLTYQGRILNMPFTSPWGMVPLFLGYAHNPYDRLTKTQVKYLSIGTGYAVNNVYGSIALRTSVASEKEKRILSGLPDGPNVLLTDARLSTPLFICIGYRF